MTVFESNHSSIATRKARSCAALALFVLAAGCSPVMEATRPDPVDISQVTAGETRTHVYSALGPPTATVKQGAGSCDIYQLYTRGPDGAGKGAIAAGEVVADVFTLGLTEVIFTPLEAGTRNRKHTVTDCYSSDDTLISQTESD